MCGCFVVVLQECLVSMLFMGGESQRVIFSVFSGYSSQAQYTGKPAYLDPNSQIMQKIGGGVYRHKPTWSLIETLCSNL